MGHTFARECFFEEEDPEEDLLLAAEGEEGTMGTGSRNLVKAFSISWRRTSGPEGRFRPGGFPRPRGYGVPLTGGERADRCVRGVSINVVGLGIFVAFSVRDVVRRARNSWGVIPGAGTGAGRPEAEGIGVVGTIGVVGAVTYSNGARTGRGGVDGIIGGPMVIMVGGG